jgi:prepilin-type N-terminal cleavage/methylation domain-containing protein
MTPRTHAARRPQGFTLIELMVVVTIIGVLSSVAIPEFGRLLLRAKSAERHEVMLRIKKAVADLYVQNGSIPGGVLVGDYQPPWPPEPSKRMPNWRAAGWATVFRSTEEIEGSTYYSYRFLADDVSNPAQPELWIYAFGDLDGDGIPSVKWVRYVRREGLYQTDETDATCSWVCPPNGQEDSLTF